MSYSLREPEEPSVCECKYDQIHDRMDREDCPFHCDIVDDPPAIEVLPAERKKPLVERAGEPGGRRTKTA